jgi:hypothetical protein
MKTMPLPIGKPVYHDSKYFEKRNINLETFYGFLDVEVNSGTSSIGLLPIKAANNYPELGIIYPLGTFRGIYFAKELMLAVSNGYTITKIHSGYSFNHAILFEQFIEKTYSLRLNASKDSLLTGFYKKLMNTLYGRFACVYDILETQYDSLEDYHLNHETDDNITSIKKIYNNIALASAITSFGRIYVYSLIKNYLNHLIYWDTDGVFFDKNVFESSTMLGQFRLISTNEQAYFIATKFYFYKPVGLDYIYTFRGVTVLKYSLRAMTIKKIFLEALHSSQKFSFRIHFLFLLKDSDLSETLPFVFYKKRLYLYQDSFLTKPYTIKNAIQASQ